jgi:hypothetical protein
VERASRSQARELNRSAGSPRENGRHRDDAYGFESENLSAALVPSRGWAPAVEVRVTQHQVCSRTGDVRPRKVGGKFGAESVFLDGGCEDRDFGDKIGDQIIDTGYGGGVISLATSTPQLGRPADPPVLW